MAKLMYSLMPSTKPPKPVDASGCLQWAKTLMGLARLDAWVLLEEAVLRPRVWLLAHPEHKLTPKQQKVFESLVKKRVQGAPIAYLTGVKEFYGLELKVNKNVLIPRPETEAMVEAALGIQLKQASVVDVGTGSGAIAIAIAKHRPAWQITATDISPAALRVARQNARLHNVNVEFIKTDLWQSMTLPDKKFDLILANLPYVKDNYELSAEGKQEPVVSLRGGADGLDIYRRFFEQLPPYMAPRAHVIIEADPWQHPELISIAKQTGLKTAHHEQFTLSFTLSEIDRL